MKIYCYWSSCPVSFIWLPLFGNFRFKSEQNFGKPNFCIFNLRRPPWFVYLVYLLPWNIFYCVVFSFYRPFEERTRWAPNLHSWKPMYLKIIGLFLLSFWYTTFIFLSPRCIISLAGEKIIWFLLLNWFLQVFFTFMVWCFRKCYLLRWKNENSVVFGFVLSCKVIN